MGSGTYAWMLFCCILSCLMSECSNFGYLFIYFIFSGCLDSVRRIATSICLSVLEVCVLCSNSDLIVFCGLPLYSNNL